MGPSKESTSPRGTGPPIRMQEKLHAQLQRTAATLSKIRTRSALPQTCRPRRLSADRSNQRAQEFQRSLRRHVVHEASLVRNGQARLQKTYFTALTHAPQVLRRSTSTRMSRDTKFPTSSPQVVEPRRRRHPYWTFFRYDFLQIARAASLGARD